MEFVETHGLDIPSIGLGTYRLEGEEGFRTVKKAIELGYRRIDTAEFYGNEEMVGRALEDTGMCDDVFVTTKVWRTNLGEVDLRSSVEESLRKLRQDSIDLLLVHWPDPETPLEETIGAMNRLQDEGKVENIGVSNFEPSRVKKAAEISRTPVVSDQVKYNPFKSQEDLVMQSVEDGRMLTAYSPLAKGKVVGNETLKEIGDRYGKSSAQVALRWLVQQEKVSAVPKASSYLHLEKNLDVFDFELTDSEMRDVFELQGGASRKLLRVLGV